MQGQFCNCKTVSGACVKSDPVFSLGPATEKTIKSAAEDVLVTTHLLAYDQEYGNSMR